MSDALYDANWRLDVKTAGRAYRDTADVSSRFLALQDDCTYAVACLKPMHTFFASQVASRKALCSEACALVTAATGASDSTKLRQAAARVANSLLHHMSLPKRRPDPLR